MKRVGWIAFVLVGCGTRPTPGPPPPVDLQKGEREVVVAASDYRTGLLLGARVRDGSPLRQVPIHSDAIVRLKEGVRFVVNRLGADNVQVVSREGNVLRQFSVGRGTNPQDIAFLDDGTAYVSRFRHGRVLRVRLSDGSEVGAGVDLAGLADADGFAEPTWMKRVGNETWLVVQRLDTAHGFVPTEASFVARLDSESDTLAGSIRLQRTNPVTAIKGDDTRGLYVGCAGRLGSAVADGALERLDPGTHTSRVLVEESELGGDVVDFDVADEHHGLAIVGGANTRLVGFDPSTGRRIGKWPESPGYDFQEVVWDSISASWWVGDRSNSGPSLRRWSASGVEQEKIPLSLPPYHLELSP